MQGIELRELYQDVILDHGKNPRNFGVPSDWVCPNSHICQAEGYNPLCGDHVTVYLRVEGNTVRQARFVGAGCAICTASASMMTEAITDKSLEAVREMFETFHQTALGNREPDIDQLGELAALSGVREFPIRIKCATLAWHAMEAALKNERLTTTEGDAVAK